VSDTRTQALRDAAGTRSLTAEERARQALADLDRRGSPISFQAVATHAGVSRAFLYTHPQLRATIEQLRDQHQHAPSRLPAHQRATDDSIRVRLRGTLEENKRLRAENAQLREELALAHGQVREPQLTRRRSNS
jgi:transposase-like protein